MSGSATLTRIARQLPLFWIARGDAKASALTCCCVPAPTLRPGTQLIREWQGRVVRIEVVEGGFLWEGRRYASLSGIAKAVTGPHWLGQRFFGENARG